MARLTICVVVIFVLALVQDSKTTDAEKSSGEITNTLQKKKENKDRSTSSESGAKESKGSDGNDSLDMAESGGSSDSGSKKKKKSKNNKFIPKSSEERPGWRKWHRKCKPCPSDAKKKWRDPTIKWICGGYQRARRSFKSKCMMTYRNCQDGTMFIKVSGGRCKNDSKADHFFYEYRVALSDDTTNSKDSDSSDESEAENSSS